MAEFPSVASAVQTGERFSHLERLIAYSQEGVSLRSDPRPKRVELDWDAALRATNEVMDQLAPALAEPTPAQCDAAIAKIEAALKKDVEAAGFTDDRALVKVLDRLEQMTPEQKAQASRCLAYWEILPWFRAGLVSCPTTKGRADARQRMSLLVLALAVHKAEKGEYPELLDPLAPGILKKLPSDPFSGKPFVYKREGKGFILSSVGPNGKDDGGKSAGPRAVRPPVAASQPAEAPADDIVVKFD